MPQRKNQVAIANHNRLTPAQFRVLGLIIDYWTEFGYGPTYAWLAERYPTRNYAINGHVRRLAAKGCVTWQDNAARTLRPLVTVEVYDDGQSL